MVFFFSKNDSENDDVDNKDNDFEAKISNMLQTKFNNVSDFVRHPRVFCESSKKIENQSENVKNTQSFNFNENISSFKTMNKEVEKINEEQNFLNNDTKSNKLINNGTSSILSNKMSNNLSLKNKNTSNSDINPKMDIFVENDTVNKSNFVYNVNGDNNFFKKSVLEEDNKFDKHISNINVNGNLINNTQLEMVQSKTQNSQSKNQNYKAKQSSGIVGKSQKINKSIYNQKCDAAQKYNIDQYNLEQKQYILQSQNKEQNVVNVLEKNNEEKDKNSKQPNISLGYSDINDVVLPKSMVQLDVKTLLTKKNTEIKSNTQTDKILEEKNKSNNNIESSSNSEKNSKLIIAADFNKINNVAASIKNKSDTFDVNNLFIGDKKVNKENCNNEEDYFYSPILEFASALPLECFNKNYSKIDKNNYLEVSKNATDDDLLKLAKRYPYLESLDVSNCDKIFNFEILNKFENLKELDVNNCDNFNNLDSIKGCKNLEILNIGNTKIKNIDAVKNFRNLKIFNCSCNNILNINALEYCEDLMEVIFWNCITLSDIGGLSSLKRIRLLDLDYTSVIDLFPLSNCLNIEFLFIDNCIKLTDIYTISILKNLKCLLADGSNMLMTNQLESFSDLENIEYMTLKYRKINTLQYFSKMTKMKELILEGCNINDLSPIENFGELIKLDLTGNSLLRDLSPINRLKNIKKLIVGGGGSAGKIGGKSAAGAKSIMNIDDVSVIKNFVKLEELDLNTNPRLKDISAIRFCENMEEVSLQNCTQLEDVSVLRYLKKLTKINLTSNPRIKDLFFLRNLPNLEELQFNGTVVYTPGLAINLKKATSLKVLKGNDADMIAQITLVSGKKKSKLQKALKKYFDENRK